MNTSPSGHSLKALIYPAQKCDVKMGCLPKMYKLEGVSLNRDGRKNVPFFFLSFLMPTPSPHHQHCHLYTVYTPLLGTAFPFFGFFSFHPSVINLMNIFLCFLYLSSFPSPSSVVLYLSDCGHVTDVYIKLHLSSSP